MIYACEMVTYIAELLPPDWPVGMSKGALSSLLTDVSVSRLPQTVTSLDRPGLFLKSKLRTIDKES